MYSYNGEIGGLFSSHQYDFMLKKNYYSSVENICAA